MCPQIKCISSLITSFIIGKRSRIQVQLTNLLYGLTRNREIVDATKQLGIGISYQDIKNLYTTWASLGMEKGCRSLPEITLNYPATAIVDNDDFKSDSLTGKFESDHRTNVMFVQKEDLIHIQNAAERAELVKGNQLKDVVDELNKITPYKTVKKGIPPIRKPFPIDPTSTDIIGSYEMIHTLCRMDNKYEDETGDSDRR